MVDRRG